MKDIRIKPMESCWDDCKDKTPADIIREIDYAAKHCPPPPDGMLLESWGIVL